MTPNPPPLVLWIPGQPVPKGRPRFGNGRTYTDTKTRDAEDYLRWKLKEAKAKPFDGALRLDMHFHRADRRGVDIDNLQKLFSIRRRVSVLRTIRRSSSSTPIWNEAQKTLERG